VSALPIAQFGFPGALRDRLVAAILSGAKTTTTGLYEESVRSGEPLSQVGSRSSVVDSANREACVIETVAVEIRPMREVGLDFALDEGEGLGTLEAWREAHLRFFTSPAMIAALGEPPVTIDLDTLVVCERFRLVELP
jgi:uncharacterized protein YhfF